MIEDGVEGKNPEDVAKTQTDVTRYMESAREIHKNTGNKGKESLVLDSLGNTFSDLGKMQEALSTLEQALRLREEYNTGVSREKECAPSFVSLAKLYTKLGDHTKALEFSIKAKEAYSKGFGASHPKGLNAYQDIVRSYIGLEQYELAWEALLVAIKIEQAQEQQARRMGRWDEFRNQLISAMPALAEKYAAQKTATDAEFSAADTNKDGVIDKEEFQAMKAAGTSKKRASKFKLGSLGSFARAAAFTRKSETKAGAGGGGEAESRSLDEKETMLMASQMKTIAGSPNSSPANDNGSIQARQSGKDGAGHDANSKSSV
jgi:tetratricopeptide (TPR) repeat protein